MPQSAFPRDEQLTGIVQAVRNQDYIADMVLPRTAPIDGEKFSYDEFSREADLTPVDDSVGRKGRVNRVDFKGERKHGETEDRGLSDVVPIKDENSFVGSSTSGVIAEKLERKIQQNREIRVANLIMNPATYGTATETLGAADKFGADTASPHKLLLERLDDPLERPNKIIFPRAEWLAFRTNKNVVKAYNGNLGDDGAVPMEWVRDFLEVEEILIGKHRINSAKLGQQETIANAWTGGVSMIHVNMAEARTMDGINFGFTVQSYDKVAYTKEKGPGEVGLRGGTEVVVGETVKEVIAAPELAGYYLDAVL